MTILITICIEHKKRRRNDSRYSSSVSLSHSHTHTQRLPTSLVFCYFELTLGHCPVGAGVEHVSAEVGSSRCHVDTHLCILNYWSPLRYARVDRSRLSRLSGWYDCSFHPHVCVAFCALPSCVCLCVFVCLCVCVCVSRCTVCVCDKGLRLYECSTVCVFHICIWCVDAWGKVTPKFLLQLLLHNSNSLNPTHT
jgi:hypothetical protein